MLFDFLVEIQEAKFGGKSCFVAIAAKHDTKDIEAGAKNFALEKDDDYGYVNAVVDYVGSKNKTDGSLMSSNVAVYFFEQETKEQVFCKAVARSVFWLMSLGVNIGASAALSKINRLNELGGQRPYEGFSSFTGTPTNKLIHNLITKNISDLVASKNDRDAILEAAISGKQGNDNLVNCEVDTVAQSRKTIKNILGMGLFLIPVKTQDMQQTVAWYNDNYTDGDSTKNIDWDANYKDTIVNVGKTISKALKEKDINVDTDNVLNLLDVDQVVDIKAKLEKAVWLCSASELLWMSVVLAENV